MDVYTWNYTSQSRGSRPWVDYRAADVTIGRARDLDEEAGRYGVVHGESGQSRTRPDTISEKSGLSYRVGRGGVDGGVMNALRSGNMLHHVRCLDQHSQGQQVHKMV